MIFMSYLVAIESFSAHVFAISHINRCRIILLAFCDFCLPFVGICLILSAFVGICLPFCRFLSAFVGICLPFVGFCRLLSVFVGN